MRRSTAVTLVLLGGGVTAMAVHSSARCRDTLTGQPIACADGQTSGGGHSSSGYIGRGSTSSASVTSASTGSVAHGGFGSAGASASAGS